VKTMAEYQTEEAEATAEAGAEPEMNEMRERRLLRRLQTSVTGGTRSNPPGRMLRELTAPPTWPRLKLILS
jgi:hypothetical protein